MAIEAFRVICAAMIETGMVGIRRVTLSRRERMVMVEPHGAGMVLFTVRAAEKCVLPSFPKRKGSSTRTCRDPHDIVQRRTRALIRRSSETVISKRCGSWPRRSSNGGRTVPVTDVPNAALNRTQ